MSEFLKEILEFFQDGQCQILKMPIRRFCRIAKKNRPKEPDRERSLS